MTPTTVTIYRHLDARQAKTRDKILRTARRLIQRDGHEAVGMEMVAATAGVSRATMYRYFASKEHLVCEAALAWGHELAARLPDVVGAVTSPTNVLDKVIDTIVAEAVSDLPMVRATMASVLAQGPLADDFRAGVRGMFTALMAGTKLTLPSQLDPVLTLLGRIFFADLALLAVGDLSQNQCADELKLAARKLLPLPGNAASA